MSTNTYPTAGTDDSAHQASNIVQMAQGIRGGTAPSNAQIQTELEATKQYLIPRADAATTAKEEKAIHDARKLVEAAQTTLVVKNHDEKLQRLAAEMNALNMASGTQGQGGRMGNKSYNRFVRKLKDITMAFGNSPNFRKSFLDLVRILREIFNVASTNSGLSGNSLRETLTNQLNNIRQSRQQGGNFGLGQGQSGLGQAGYGQTGLGQTGLGQTGLGQTGGYAGQTGLGQTAYTGQPGLGQTGLLPSEPGYNAGLHTGLTGQTGLLPGQPGYVHPGQTGLLPGQPGYVHTGLTGQTGLLPGQPGYVAPVAGQTSYAPNLMPTGGLLGAAATGAAAGIAHHEMHNHTGLGAQTGLGQPGYVGQTGLGAQTSLGQPGYVDQTGLGHTGLGHTGLGAQTGLGHTGLGAQTGLGQPGYVGQTGLGQTGLGQTGLGGQSGSVGQQAGQVASNIIDNIPDEHKQRFIQQLKDFLHEANANQETNQIMRELFSIWGSLSGNLYNQLDSIRTSSSGTSLPQTAKAVVEEFTGDRSLDDFLEYLRYSTQIIDQDIELRDYLSEVRDYFIMALDDPELIDSDDYYYSGSDLLQRGRIHTSKYSNHPVFVGLFEEARLLSEEIRNDTTLNLLKDRSQAFLSNFVYKDPRTNTPKIDFDLVDRMRATLVPFIIDRVREIPIPRIEVSNQDFEYLIIDDLHLLLGNILPDQVTIHSRSLAKIAAEARGALNNLDANAGSSRVVNTGHDHVHTNVGDTHLHVRDDSRSHSGSSRNDDDYDNDDSSSDSDDDDDYNNRPSQVRVGGKDVTNAGSAVHPSNALGGNVGTTGGSYGTGTSGGSYGTTGTGHAHSATVSNPITGSTTTAVSTGTTPGTSGAGLNQGSRIRFRIANIKPEFRNFYFSMKRRKAPAITDEGRMNMSLKNKGLTIVGAFSLVQNAAGLSQITNQRIRISMGRVKFDVLQAKHKMMLKLGFLFMGKTISRQVETQVQQKLERLIVEWSDVLNQKVMTHLPPVDQMSSKATSAVTRVTDKVAEKTA